MSETTAKVIRLSWREAPAVLAYGAPVVLLVLYLYVGNYFPQLYGAVLSWWHLILAGIGGLTAWAGLSGRLTPLGRVGGTLMASGLVLAAVASLTAMDATRSVVNSWLLAGYLALFWITLTAARRWGRRWLTWTLAIGSMALALCGLFIDANGTTYAGFDVRSVPPFTFPLGNKNFTASFFLLVWPFFIGAAQSEDETLPRWTLIGGALLSLYCLFGSDSRAAYLAAAVQLVLLGVMLAGPTKRALGQIPRKIWAGLAAGVLVTGVAVVAATPVGERVSSVVRTVTEVADGGQVSDNSAAMRLEMWRGALAGYGERAVQGHGLGSVPTHFPANRMQSPRYPDVVNPQLHSTPFHVLYELGVAGVLMLVAIAAYLLWALWQVLRQARPAPEAIGIGVGLLGYGFSLLTDFHWEVPSLTVSFALGAALLVAAIRDDDPPAVAIKPASLAGGLLGVAVLGGGLTMLVTKDRAALAYDRGYAALSAGQYQPGIDAWREAIALDPSTPFYKVALGSTIHYLTNDQPNGAADVQKLREEALTMLTGATDSVHLALAKIKQGNLLVRLNRPQEAIAPLTEATRLTYYAPVPHYFLAEAYRALGERDKAIQAYGTALAFSPALQWASLWQSGEGAALREPVAKYALSLYQRQGAPDEWLSRHMGQLYVMLGQRAQAEAILEPLLAADNPNRESARLWYGEAAFRAKDWAAASARFAAVLEAQPANGFAKVRLAQAKYQQGDASLVSEGLAALSASYGNGATEAMIKDPAVMAQATIPIGFDTRKGWANMAYRRAAPDQPFPNPIPIQPAGMFFLGDEKPWPGFPRVTYRQLVAAADGQADPALAKLPIP